MSKQIILAIPLLVTALSAMADLELTIDTEYPRRLELKIPVQEDSDFEVRASFGYGEFFTATGHVGRVTGVATNRSISLTYGYEYGLGSSQGSATGSQDQALGEPYSVRIVSSIWAANPRFTVREVAPPISPATWFTNMTRLTNVTSTILTNAPDQRGQPSSRPEGR